MTNVSGAGIVITGGGGGIGRAIARRFAAGGGRVVVNDLDPGAAAAVARWTRQGRHVAYVLATAGEAGIEGMAPDVVGPLREDEERRSAGVVGVSDVDFLGHADGLVEYGVALRRDLAAAFRRLQPHVVIGMSFDLTWGEEGPVNHSDHRAVGLATLDACRDADNEWVFPEAGPRATDIRDAYVAGTGAPTHFVDVTDTPAWRARCRPGKRRCPRPNG